MTHEEYLALIQEIKRHNVLYYQHDAPEITDAEYDQLTQKLKQIEARRPNWISPMSPTQHVGTGDLKANKTRHRLPLLSLNDLFDLTDVKTWWENLGRPGVNIEHKIDGLTCALTYIDNNLVLAATRGDGRTGEIVTEQAKRVAGVPCKLTPPPRRPRRRRLQRSRPANSRRAAPRRTAVP